MSNRLLIYIASLIMACIFFPLTLDLTDEDLLELRTLAPDAAVLTSFENSDTDTASETEEEKEQLEELPEPLASMYDPTLGKECIAEKSEEAFLKMKRELHPEQCKRLEEKTRQQAKCQEWLTHREGRITSTTFHSVSQGGAVPDGTIKKNNGLR